jgi:CheY-like chemotaxis protein
MRVLVVDDLVDAADSLAALLAVHGHEVRVAYDGVEALAVAAEQRPHAVVVDINMPRLDGFGLAQRLRQEYGRDLRLIAHSAWSDVRTRERAAECGFDRHLTKPATVHDVLSALDK